MAEEDERRLERIQRATGWTVSEILKHGLETLESELAKKPPKSAYEIYLELGINPAEPTRDRAARSGDLARDAIRRKHARARSGRE